MTKPDKLMGWQPIETYEGGYALFFQPRIKQRVADLQERMVVDNARPNRRTSHWMPLPKPPEDV